jgi:tRNA threonylcarbamoyladenosine biosynthesis protein TsaB
MGELYWGCFVLDAQGLMRLSGREEVAAPGLVEIPPGSIWSGVGSGWAVFEDSLRPRLAGRLDGIEPSLPCEARDIATLAVADLRSGLELPAEQAVPVYLRDRVTAAT